MEARTNQPHPRLRTAPAGSPKLPGRRQPHPRPAPGAALSCPQLDCSLYREEPGLTPLPVPQRSQAVATHLQGQTKCALTGCLILRSVTLTPADGVDGKGVWHGCVRHSLPLHASQSLRGKWVTGAGHRRAGSVTSKEPSAHPVLGLLPGSLRNETSENPDSSPSYANGETLISIGVDASKVLSSNDL